MDGRLTGSLGCTCAVGWVKQCFESCNIWRYCAENKYTMSIMNEYNKLGGGGGGGGALSDTQDKSECHLVYCTK